MPEHTKASVINYVVRALIVVSLLSVLFFLDDFIEHFEAHFGGGITDQMISGNWLLVIANIAVFCAFLIPLAYRRKVSWKEYGVVTAFFVSLFIEMYGIPLSVLFASKYIGGEHTVVANTVWEAEVLGVGFGFTVPMIYGAFLMTLGTVFIIWGWISLYGGLKKNELVTGGIYSISRHPQYVGFLMVIIGWVVGWPTLLTVIFGPILVFMYIRVCKKEERELDHDTDYASYKKRTPFLV